MRVFSELRSFDACCLSGSLTPAKAHGRPRRAEGRRHTHGGGLGVESPYSDDAGPSRRAWMVCVFGPALGHGLMGFFLGVPKSPRLKDRKGARWKDNVC